MTLSPGPPDSSSIGTPLHANPFRMQIIQIERIINPQFPAWALAILIFFAVMRGILIVVCIAIMVIPLGKGPASRKKHWFLFRRIYSRPGRCTPYVVPNRSMIIAVGELCSSILYMVAACENYEIYKHLGLRPGSIGWYLILWYGLTWLPSYIGIMLSAWSLCYACLCDVAEIKNSRFPRMLTPAVYNAAWSSWLIISIALMAYWSILIARNCHATEMIVNRILELLRRAAFSWETDGTTQISWSVFVHELTLSAHQVDEIGTLIYGWCITWIVLAVLLAVFYLFTVQLLLRMLNQILCKRELDAMVVDAQLSSPIWPELEKEFRFLCKSSSLVTLSILSQIAEVAYQTYSGKNLVKLNWRIASAIATQLPGVFMTPALLVQSWRIVTERSDESKFQQVPLAFGDQNIPQMTSHILGWDTTVFWDNERELESSNFPGLHEVQSTKSKKTEDDVRVNMQATLRNPTDDISVVRSTVVTREQIEIIPMSTSPCF